MDLAVLVIENMNCLDAFSKLVFGEQIFERYLCCSTLQRFFKHLIP